MTSPIPLFDGFQAHEIDHLVIPTRDYLFAPSFVDISRAVDFIHSEQFFFDFTSASSVILRCHGV